MCPLKKSVLHHKKTEPGHKQWNTFRFLYSSATLLLAPARVVYKCRGGTGMRSEWWTVIDVKKIHTFLGRLYHSMVGETLMYACPR